MLVPSGEVIGLYNNYNTHPFVYSYLHIRLLYYLQKALAEFYKDEADMINFLDIWMSTTTFLDKLKVVYWLYVCPSNLYSIFEIYLTWPQRQHENLYLFTGGHFHYMLILSCFLVFQASLAKKFPRDQTDGRFVEYIHNLLISS